MNKQKRSFVKVILSFKESGAAIPLVILITAVAFVNRNFFGIFNLMDILRTASFSMMVAVPMTLLMSAGGMDLSLGAAISLGGVICGKALNAGMPIPVAIILAMCGGSLVGLANGISVVKFGLPGFILTLGTQYCVNGIINVWTSGMSIIGLPEAFVKIGQHRIGKIVPLPIIYAVVIAIVGFIVLQYTKYGRRVLAIGGNRETARLSGINVTAIRIATYVTVSTMAALAGVIYGARFATVQPAIGSGQEMTIMAAVIVGGTSNAGGVGTVIGTVIGSILLAMTTNILIMLGVSAYWQSLVFGVILILSLFIDRYRQEMLKA